MILQLDGRWNRGDNDWFLPSKDEWNQMCENLHLQELGGFTSDEAYWSSFEANANIAWLQDIILRKSNSGVREPNGEVG